MPIEKFLKELGPPKETSEAGVKVMGKKAKASDNAAEQLLIALGLTQGPEAESEPAGQNPIGADDATLKAQVEELRARVDQVVLNQEQKEEQLNNRLEEKVKGIEERFDEKLEEKAEEILDVVQVERERLKQGRDAAEPGKGEEEAGKVTEEEAAKGKQVDADLCPNPDCGADVSWSELPLREGPIPFVLKLVYRICPECGHQERVRRD